MTTHISYLKGQWEISGDPITMDKVAGLRIEAGPDTNFRPTAVLVLVPGAVELELADVDTVADSVIVNEIVERLDLLDVERLRGEIRGGLSEDPVAETVAKLIDWARKGAL